MSVKSHSKYLPMVFASGRLADESDAQLLGRLGNVDEHSHILSILVERHGKKMFDACRAIIGRSSDTEDVIQAALLVLLRKPPKRLSKDSLGPWLYGVTRRIAKDVRRKALHRRNKEQKAAAMRPEFEENRESDLQEIYEEIKCLPTR